MGENWIERRLRRTPINVRVVTKRTMIVVAIDPGIRNLGWAVYNTTTACFISFGRYDLLKDQPKNLHTKYAHLVRSFVDASSDVFAMADAVAIEIQMTAKFKVIATAFQCFFWGKSYRVSPRSVRCHFKISTGNYAKNKKASIELIPSLDIPAKNKAWYSAMDKNKRDDVADAMLLALYWSCKHREKPNKKAHKSSKKRRRIE